jgi:hypothetical protein
MKGILTSLMIGMLLTTGAMAGTSRAISGTAAVDEANLEELKINNKELQKQEESSTRAVKEKQKEMYRLVGAQDGKGPIFRPGRPVDSDD